MSNDRPGGFAFSCPLNLDTIWHKFKTTTSWKWTGHDSDTYGDYLIGRPYPSDETTHRVRLFRDGSDYIIDFDYDWEAIRQGKTTDHILNFVREQLLPIINAANVRETSAFR